MFVLRCIIAAINCFVAGTVVLTSQGLVPIEQIKPNDIVWAMDEVTREAGWKPVVQTFVTAGGITPHRGWWHHSPSCHQAGFAA